jgi:hypothetical protein
MMVMQGTEVSTPRSLHFRGDAANNNKPDDELNYDEGLEQTMSQHVPHSWQQLHQFY